MSEIVTLLATWTPFLFVGFLWNIGVTILAVTIGTGVGAVFAFMRFGESSLKSKTIDFVSRVFRNVPTLAFLFFFTFAIPREFTVWGTVIVIPLWFKAGVGLSASVIGFTSESLLLARQNLVRKDYAAALLFIPTWGSSVMISFIASSTASLVGVSELISRSNSLIAATGTGFLIPVYLYCALFFVLGCLSWMALINRLKSSEYVRAIPERLSTRLLKSGQTTGHTEVTVR
jgi:polar amino acid transport system permease protein